MSIQALKITNFQAINVGNGKTVELSWSVPDISFVKYFVVEMWDRHRKKWMPYDGFRGVIAGEGGSAPQQRAVFDVEDSNCEVSFRVKAVSHDYEESDWSNSSVEVKVSGEQYAETDAFFVKEGLEVYLLQGYNIGVRVGVAYLGGFRRYLARDTQLRLPDGANKSYVVYIDINGIVSYAEGTVTPANAIRLANVIVDANGTLSIYDTRFLWAPSGFSVHFDSSSSRLHYLLSWEEYSEPNLRSWKIYRATGISPSDVDYKPLVVLERGTNSYEDVSQLIKGETYWYKISALDWGGNESPLSPAVRGDSFDIEAPAVPTGLTAYPGGNVDDIYIDLSWNPNNESDLLGYKLWLKKDDNTYELLNAIYAPSTTYRHVWLARGETYTYALSAFDKWGNESDKCPPVSAQAGDLMPPGAPEWELADPITTGSTGFGEETCWIKLNWQEVTENQDGSPVTDLYAYRVYRVTDSGKFLSAQLLAGVTEYTLQNLFRGVVYRFVVTAVDKWGNESEDSTLQSVAAGGLAPAVPALISVEAVGDRAVKVTFQKVDKNVDLSPADDIKGYIIYRGINPSILVEIGRIDAESPQPDVYEFLDTTVVRGETYYYAVTAYDKDFNESEKSNVLSVSAGDFEAPSPPQWVSLTTMVEEDGTISNNLQWTTGGEGDLKGVYVYSSTAPGGFQLIGFAPAGTNSYVHAGLTNGVTYYYRLVAFDESGNLSEPSETRSITAGVTLAPEAPIASVEGIFDASQRIAGVRVSWAGVNYNNDDPPTPVSFLEGYRVYRSISGLEHTLIADIKCSVPGQAQSYDDWGLVNGKRYYYKVSAYNKFGIEGPASVPVEVLAGDISAPGAPSVECLPTFDPKSPSVVVISLNISLSPAPDHYNVYLSEDGSKWALVGTTTSTYNYSVPYGSTTHYRVTAVSIAGVEGPPTSGSYTAVHTDVPADVSAPSVVFRPLNNGYFAATVSWVGYTPPSDFARYEILFDSSSPRAIASITDKDTKTYELQGFQAGGNYSFAVVCVDVFGLRSVPQWQTVSPADTTKPKAPAGITASGRILSIYVEWSPVTENEDNTQCFDLKDYVLELADNPDFTTIARTVYTLGTTYVHECGYDGKTWYFRVKARDVYGNESSTYAVSSGASALPVESGTFADDAPEPVTWPDPFVLNSSGVEVSSLDEGQNVWVEFSWNPVSSASLDHYNIYLSSNGTDYYQVAQSKTNSTRLNNLLANTTYWVKVSGVSRLNNEGVLSTAQQFTTPRLERTLDPPSNLGVVEGKNLLALRWDPHPIKNVEYILEYRATSDPPGSPTRTYSPDWTQVYKGKGTSFVHTSLEYHRYYQYRIKAIDLSGNESVWAEFPPDLAPDQIGSEDLAANSIYASHIYSNQIQAQHIASNSIEARHLMADSVTAGKVAAGAITARELNVRLGGYNYVKNSAFGMLDQNGNLGVNWSLTGSAEILSGIADIPIRSTYCLHALRSSTLDPPAGAGQSLPAQALAGKKIIVSCYVKTQNITGQDCHFELGVKKQDNTWEWPSSGPIVGTAGWNRKSFTYTVPTDAVQITLQVHLEGQAVGELWATGFQVEEGELITPWNPNPDEVYGASGSVQINSSGIRVVEGKIRVETANSMVTITSDGILAKKSDTAWARLDSSGLTVQNGAFSISSATGTESTRLDITGTGIVARKNGVETFSLSSSGDLNVFNGTFKFNSTQAGTPRLELSANGLKAYSASSETFSLDATTGSLRLSGGQFAISTIGPPETQEGIVIDGTGIKAYRPGGSTSFRLESSTGNVGIYGGAFKVSTKPEGEYGERIVLDGSGIRAYDATSTSDNNGIAFRLSTLPIDDARFFLKGGFKIASTSETNQIYFDETGIYGPSFSLTQGYGTTPAGLTITNGNIYCGNVKITPEGMTVDGGSGIKLTTGGVSPTELVSLDSQGITVKEGLGIKIKGSGSIAFEPDPNNPGVYSTAIDKTGVKAEAITSGVITVTGSQTDSKPRIEVKDGNTLKAQIDKDGIKIYGGALNVYSDSGNDVLIENGRIKASAFQIGSGASNLIRNGRGDFGTSNWAEGTLSVSVAQTMPEAGGAKAGVSGDYAFRLSGNTGQDFKQDVTNQKTGFTYTFSCWVYLVSGSLEVSIANSNAQPKLVSTANQYTRVSITFSPTATPVTYTFTAKSDNTIAYVTDICSVEGNISSSFVPHSTELAASDRSVLINDSGITITNGKFNLYSSTGNLSITGSGIHHNAFDLDISGLALRFPDQHIFIDNINGLRMEDPQNPSSGYVKLNPAGLVIQGDGLVNIRNRNGSIRITSDSIRATKEGTSYYAELNSADGLKVVGGAINIQSATSGARLQLINDKLSVYDTSGTETVQVGRAQYYDDQGQKVSTYGLVCTGGSFYLASDNGSQKTVIQPTRLKMEDATSGQAVILTPGNLEFKTNTGSRGIPKIEMISEITANIEGTPYYFSTAFSKMPCVVLVPLAFPTYDASKPGRNQILDMSYEWISSGNTYTGMIVKAYQLIDSYQSQISIPSYNGQLGGGITSFTSPILTTAQDSTKITGRIVVISKGVLVWGGLHIHAYVYLKKASDPDTSYIQIGYTEVGGGNSGELSSAININYLLPEIGQYNIKVYAEVISGNGYGGVVIGPLYSYQFWPYALPKPIRFSGVVIEQ